MPAIEYDGRYDGPGYSHPFWPRVGYPPIKARRGYMEMCQVCCTDRQGVDLSGATTLPHGSPHQNAIGLGMGLWPYTVVVEDDGEFKAGAVALTCIECSSFRVLVSTRLDTGLQYGECQDCYAVSDRPHVPYVATA